jgi:hypothetical protein
MASTTEIGRFFKKYRNILVPRTGFSAAAVPGACVIVIVVIVGALVVEIEVGVILVDRAIVVRVVVIVVGEVNDGGELLTGCTGRATALAACTSSEGREATHAQIRGLKEEAQRML